MRSAGHHDNWLPKFEGRYDRAHPRVAYDKPSRANTIAKLRGIKELHNLNMLRLVIRSSDLRKDISPAAQSGPYINGADQTVERICRANGDKDHSTEPL
jgi:hypothetical protein